MPDSTPVSDPYSLREGDKVSFYVPMLGRTLTGVLRERAGMLVTNPVGVNFVSFIVRTVSGEFVHLIKDVRLVHPVPDDSAFFEEV